MTRITSIRFKTDAKGSFPRLFCFPYAGASASIYSLWGARLHHRFDVIPVGLPGRGARLRERPFHRMEHLATQIMGELAPMLHCPFAFFGHSMGALLAFEVVRLLRKVGAPEPQHLLVSGAKAPQCWKREAPTYGLPDSEFLESVRKLNGTPIEVFAHRELLDAVLPALRADFAICETYQYCEEERLCCPITAYGGTDDERIPPESLEAWKAQTSAQFTYHILPGGHFFLHSAEIPLLKLVAEALHGNLQANPGTSAGGG